MSMFRKEESGIPIEPKLSKPLSINMDHDALMKTAVKVIKF